MSYPKTPEEIYNWVKENERLVFWILHKHFPKFVIEEYLRYYSREEILHTAYIAACRATETFDDSYNTEYNSWATGYIKMELVKEIFNILPVHIAKKMTNLYDKYSTVFNLLNGKIYITHTTDPDFDRNSDGFEPWFEVVDENEDIEYNTLIKVYFEEIVNFIRNKFSERDVNIFLLRYVDNLSFREIGEIYNISKQRVEQIINKIFRHLKEYNYIEPDTVKKLRKIHSKREKK